MNSLFDTLYSILREFSDALYIFAANGEELSRKRAIKIEEVISPPSASIPEHLKKKARLMSSLVERVQSQLDDREDEVNKIGKTEVLKNILSEESICLSTYYNYLGALKKSGHDANRLAVSLHRSNFGKFLISKAQQHFLDKVILGHKTLPATDVFKIAKAIHSRTGGLWINPDLCERVPDNLVEELIDSRIPMASILNNDTHKRLLEPIKLVSRSFFFQYYRGLTADLEMGKELIDEKYGEGTWDKWMKVFDTFTHLATHPLQYVFADHYLLDIFTVDEETRAKPIRLWVTILIDVYTRCILGITLLNEGPCIESIQDALFNSIWPKDSLLEEWGIEGRWYGHGISIQLFLDNALAHHSHSLEAIGRGIRGSNDEFDTINLVFRMPYMARQGALIERYFGNLSYKLKTRLRGKVAIQSSNPKDVRHAMRDAILLHEDINRFLLEEITEYQNKPNEGIGKMTPNQKWLDAMNGRQPLIPPKTKANERLFWRMHHDTRELGNKGISLFNLKYSSPELSKQSCYSRNGEKKKFGIRYQKGDISRIAVFDGDRYLCDAYASELRLPDGSYRHISLAELNIAKAFANANANSLNSSTASRLLQHLSELENTANIRKTEKKQRKKTPKHSSTTIEIPTHPNSDDLGKSDSEDSSLLAAFGRIRKNNQSTIN